MEKSIRKTEPIRKEIAEKLEDIDEWNKIWCTVQFNAFLQDKVTTQRIKGGNTKEFYAQEGTLAKSQMQVDLHPDISKVVWRFGRWHHYVDYGIFKKNKLQLKDNIEIPQGTNEYGMKLIDIRTKQEVVNN